MTAQRSTTQPPLGHADKEPDDWKTGDHPMTDAQRAHLKTLTEAAHESFDETLTQAEASQRIDEIRARTGTAPKPDSPLEAFGKSVSETVLGSQPGGAAGARRRES